MKSTTRALLLQALVLAGCAGASASDHGSHLQNASTPAEQPSVIEQTIQFDGVTPARLYQIYLSQDEHAAFTGFPTQIDPREGGEIDTFINVPVPGARGVTGRILQLDAGAHDPNQFVIVQSWRGYHDAATAADSTLVLTFTKTAAGAQIKLAQVNVPADLIPLVSASWQERYWQPLGGYLKDHATNP